MDSLLIDFETRGTINLKERGSHVYASDLNTDIICMSAIWEDIGNPERWLWYAGEPLPDDLHDALIDAHHVKAHNASFDQQIYECIAVNDYGFPIIPASKWFCTMAQARVNGLPASLDKLGRALKTNNQKDFTGAKLIKQLCIPQEDGSFNRDPELIKKFGAYCMKDSLTMRDAVSKLRQLTTAEHNDWLINERINARGIRVDIALATDAQKYAEAEALEIAKEMKKITGGVVQRHTQHLRIRNWIFTRCPEETHKDLWNLMTTYKTEGKRPVKKFSLDKAIRSQILGRADAEEITIPHDVYNMIAALHEGSKSSVAKFKNMILRADPVTDRVHNAFNYAGAATTLRHTSMGLQVHNMLRKCFSYEATMRLKGLMEKGEILTEEGGEPMGVMIALGKLIRPAIIPAPKKIFIVSDWSAIEARVLPWLAHSKGAERVLDVFREGRDIYKIAAADFFMKPVEEIADIDDERQVGKVIILSLGYGGSVGAFNSMAKNYGVNLPNYQVQRIVDNWRSHNNWALTFWKQLENAAKNALRHPGQKFDAGRVTYVFIPDLIGGTLLCIMPGGNIIQYPQARIENIKGEWGMQLTLTALKASFNPKAEDKEWPRITLWGGLLAENISQSFSGKILRNVLTKFEDIVLHVHDEVVREVPEEDAEVAAIELQAAMKEVPDFASGLPLDADIKIMQRYGK